MFNLAYTKWAGRMDSERIESGWAQSTSMATWTQESGPNACHNILDDHWNLFNWQKLLGLHECLYVYRVSCGLNMPFSGKMLERNLHRSLAWNKSQQEVATLISGAYSAATVNKWCKMRDEFD